MRERVARQKSAADNSLLSTPRLDLHLRAATLAVPLALLASCASVMKLPAPDEVAQIRPGTWTQQQVLHLLGLPNRIRTTTLPDGGSGDVWIYATVPYASATDIPFMYISGRDPDDAWPGEDAVWVTFSGDAHVHSVETPWQ